MPIKVYQRVAGRVYEFPKYTFKFHAGEVHTKIYKYIGYDGIFPSTIYIKFDFDGSDSVFELLMIVDVLHREYGKLDLILEMPYCPYGRGDKVENPGEPLPLKVFAKLINDCNFKKVIVEDAHSKVTLALIDRCEEIKQSKIHHEWLMDRKPFWVVAPDPGAYHKAFKLSTIYFKNCLGIVACEKIRDTQDKGKIVRTEVHFPRGIDCSINKDFLIVDDIAAGGRSFIEIAKVIKATVHEAYIILVVTHGFFTEGLDVFDGLIDEIYTRNGRVK